MLVQLTTEELDATSCATPHYHTCYITHHEMYLLLTSPCPGLAHRWRLANRTQSQTLFQMRTVLLHILHMYTILHHLFCSISLWMPCKVWRYSNIPAWLTRFKWNKTCNRKKVKMAQCLINETLWQEHLLGRGSTAPLILHLSTRLRWVVSFMPRLP
jgi:hypothetical protein